MKPAAFSYVTARSLDEAVDHLAESGGDGKVIAGGQSLVPLMNFRFARPSVLVDVNRVADLSGIRRSAGDLRIGAATRQASAERSRVIAAHWPLLTQALPYVAHPQIRNRGTVGGSVAHADPGSEICTVLLAYDGHVEATSRAGTRRIAAQDLFLGQFVTTLEADEVLTSVVLPSPRRGTRTSFHEVARRRGDFALAGAAAVVTIDDHGRCTHAALCMLGAAPTPIRRQEAEAVLVGNIWSHDLAEEAVRVATVGIDPASDVHGSSAYRVRAAAEMVRRCLRDAFAPAASHDVRPAS